jgi:site-specific DNA recombinase
MGQEIGSFLGRTSTEKQRDESIEDQLRLCLEKADRLDIIIPEKYRFFDLAVSGSVHKRKGLQQLLSALNNNPEIKFVFVDELSRLSRCDLQTLVTFYQLIENDKVLIAVSDNIDTRGPNAKLQIHLKALVNNMRLDELRAETKRGLMGQKLKGRSAGEKVFGYRTIPDGNIINKKGGPRPEGYKHVIDEQQSKVVKVIFELYDKGHSPFAIAKKLNEEGPGALHRL